MSLKDKINTDLVAAIKSGDAETVSTLRFLNSVIKNKELEKRTRIAKEGKAPAELENLSALSDEEATAVILGEIKKRKESIAQYKAGGREELAEKEAVELEILKKYVPEEMPEEELRELIKNKIAGISDFGKAIGAVMAEVKGRADGALVKKIIEEEMK